MLEIGRYKTSKTIKIKHLNIHFMWQVTKNYPFLKVVSF